MQKILSFVLIARDDSYTEKFSERLSFCLRYLDHTLRDHKETVEVCLVEWGTTTLLKQCDLSGIQNIAIRWISVDEHTAKAASDKPIHMPLAYNVGLREASGQYIVIGPSDNMMSKASITRLLEICSNMKKHDLSGKELFAIPRRFLPRQWKELNKTHQEMDTYFKLISSANFPFVAQRINSLAGTGSFMMHRNEWHKARGMSEARPSHGGDDIQLLSRVAESKPHIDLSNWGIWQFKLPRTQGTRNELADPGDWDKTYFSTTPQENGEDWGRVANVRSHYLRKKGLRATTSIEKRSNDSNNDPKLCVLRSLALADKLSGVNSISLMRLKIIQRLFSFNSNNNFVELLCDIIKRSKSSFLVSDIDIFAEFGYRLFLKNKDLAGVITFNKEQSKDGEVYEKKFVKTISSITQHGHFGHITTYRRHSKKSLDSISKRFQHFSSGVGIFRDESVFFEQATDFSESLKNLPIVICKQSKREGLHEANIHYECLGTNHGWHFLVKKTRMEHHFYPYSRKPSNPWQ